MKIKIKRTNRDKRGRLMDKGSKAKGVSQMMLKKGATSAL